MAAEIIFGLTMVALFGGAIVIAVMGERSKSRMKALKSAQGQIKYAHAMVWQVTNDILSMNKFGLIQRHPDLQSELILVFSEVERVNNVEITRCVSDMVNGNSAQINNAINCISESVDKLIYRRDKFLALLKAKDNETIA